MTDGSDSNPFKIAATPEPRVGLGRQLTETDPAADPAERVRTMVKSSEVFLLIKGTPDRPMCGFSANTVAVMDALEVPYLTFDILSDEDIRSAAKQVAGWPTFPQVYVRGEFVGGNDIVTEMYHDGEFQDLVAGIG